MTHHNLPPEALAEFDQLQAELRNRVLSMADQAATGGRACCGHALCPGDDVLRSLAGTVMTGGAMALMGYLTCALRLLGDTRYDTEVSR